MTAALDTVHRVDAAVWDTTDYRRDPPNKDIWGNITFEEGASVGDCEEWADRAMDGLLAAGIPPDRIGAALCHTKGREGYDHAVCLVMVDELGLMTCGDSYSRAGPCEISNTRYRFDRFMRLDQPGVWRLWND